jgi:UPF0148 protein
MVTRKEEEIMAEYLLKGGKMLEKSCKTCGCPLFEVKGKTLCVVCAENAIAAKAAPAAAAKAAAPAAALHAHHEHTHEHGEGCTCGQDHDEESCSCGDDECGDGGLTEELAFTIHSLCLRIQNERDPNHVLTLMTAIKEGTDALETLCKL